MVEPLRATVKLLVLKLPPSWMTTWSPSDGDAGKLTVNGPLVVSMMYNAFLDSVVVVVTNVHATNTPDAPAAPVAPAAPRDEKSCHSVPS
jgi:hypothetical protein